MLESKLEALRGSDWSRIGLHLIVWVALWQVIRHFTIPTLTKDNLNVVVHASIQVFSQSIFIFYFLGYFVFPRYLLRKKFGLLLIISALLFQLIYLVNYLEFRHLVEISDTGKTGDHLYVGRVWYQFMSKHSLFDCLIDKSLAFINYSWSFFYVTPLLAIKVMIDVVESRTKNLILERDLFKLEATNLGLESDRLKLQRDYLMLEISFLRSQVNPHFLFNTLNVVYGKLLDADNDAADSIARLANLMRYSLYVSSKDLVAIRDELQYIESYIELEKSRFEEILDISFHVSVDDEAFQIAPLIMIAFVENAFKHVVHQEGAIVHVSIVLKNGVLEFTARNTMRLQSISQSNPLNISEASPGGVGLDNVQKRLQILYEGNYSLIFNIEGGIFSIKLVITGK